MRRFRLPLREPWPPGKHASRPCPVCGMRWVPWAGSRLPCHGRCLLSSEARAELVRIFRTDPTRGLAAVAESFGVTPSVLRATLHDEGVGVR
jgi:hypothetical protein